MSELPLSIKTLWQAPLGWLGVSLLCGVCLWLFFQQIPAPYHRSLRNARWIIIPYLGMLTGGISPRLLGLTGINWFASFGFGLVLIGSVLVVLIIVRSVIAFSAAPAATFPTAPEPPARLTTPADLPHTYTTTFPISFLAIGAEEFHLAFLRSASWELLLAWPLSHAQALYGAAWIALALAVPEALYHYPTTTQRLCKGALLVATTVLFIFTRNLWLSWLLHLLGWMLLSPASGRDKAS